MTITIAIALTECASSNTWVQLQDEFFVKLAQASRREGLEAIEMHRTMLKLIQHWGINNEKTFQLDEADQRLKKTLEELATDLLLSNLDYPNWGWHQSYDEITPDFWSEYSHLVRFVFGYISPVEYLSEVFQDIENKDSVAVAIDEALNSWIDAHEKILEKFYKLGDRATVRRASIINTKLSQIDHLLFNAIVKSNPAVLKLISEFDALNYQSTSDVVDDSQYAIQIFKILREEALVDKKTDATCFFHDSHSDAKEADLIGMKQEIQVYFDDSLHTSTNLENENASTQKIHNEKSIINYENIDKIRSTKAEDNIENISLRTSFESKNTDNEIDNKFEYADLGDLKNIPLESVTNFSELVNSEVLRTDVHVESDFEIDSDDREKFSIIRKKEFDLIFSELNLVQQNLIEKNQEINRINALYQDEKKNSFMDKNSLNTIINEFEDKLFKTQERLTESLSEANRLDSIRLSQEESIENFIFLTEKFNDRINSQMISLEAANQEASQQKENFEYYKNNKKVELDSLKEEINVLRIRLRDEENTSVKSREKFSEVTKKYEEDISAVQSKLIEAVSESSRLNAIKLSHEESLKFLNSTKNDLVESLNSQIIALEAVSQEMALIKEDFNSYRNSKQLELNLLLEERDLLLIHLHEAQDVCETQRSRLNLITQELANEKCKSTDSLISCHNEISKLSSRISSSENELILCKDLNEKYQKQLVFEQSNSKKIETQLIVQTQKNLTENNLALNSLHSAHEELEILYAQKKSMKLKNLVLREALDTHISFQKLYTPSEIYIDFQNIPSSFNWTDHKIIKSKDGTSFSIEIKFPAIKSGSYAVEFQFSELSIKHPAFGVLKVDIRINDDAPTPIDLVTDFESLECRNIVHTMGFFDLPETLKPWYISITFLRTRDISDDKSSIEDYFVDIKPEALRIVKSIEV